MRVLVVDDHEVVRRGVRSLLESPYDVCGEAVDGLDAIEKARQLTPDVIVMDVSMPRLNGLEATRRLRSLLPECEILILSQHEAPEMARQALKAGARGYVVKTSMARDLISALAKVSRREYFFDPAILEQTPSAHIDVQEILQRSAAFEKALRDSEARLRKLADYQSAVMNNMAEGLYALDENGLLTSINQAGEAILGWTKEELLGKKMHDVTHYKHSDGSPFPASECPGLRVVREGAVLREYEDTFIHKDGSFVPVVFSASPLMEDGKIAGVIVSFRDDSEQRHAREALLSAKRELEISSSHLQLVTASMAASVTRCSKDLRYLWVNQGYSDWVRRPVEQIVGKSIVDVIGKDAFDKLLPHFKRVLAGERVSYEEEVIFHSIGRRWITAIYTPTLDETGTPDGWVAVALDITARRQTEEALRESQKQLALALKASRTAMFEWDLVSGRGKWNPEMAAIYGFRPEAEHITPEQWRNLFHPDDRARLTEEAERVWQDKNQEEFNFEFRTVPRNGEIKWITSHGRIHRDAEGKAVRMIGVHSDITDRKRIEQALQRHESRLRAAFEQTYSFLILLEIDGTIVDLNRAAVEAASGSRDELLGRKFWEVSWWSSLPEEVVVLKADIAKAARGEWVRGECHYCLPDGTRRFADRTLSPVRDENGKVGMIVATGLDITDRQHTEEVTGLLAAIVASSDDAIVSKNLDGIISSWNKGAERMFGYTAEEAIGQHIRLIVPQDRHSEETDILQRLRRGERIDHFHTVRLRKDGGLIDVSLTISPVRDSSGRVIGASKVARDITAQKETEKALRESEQRLRIITDAAPIMVWMSGTDKLCYYFNKGWLDFVGRSIEQEARGWTENVHPDDFDRCLQIYESSFDARRRFEMQYRLRHHTGEYRWIVDCGVPRYAPDGTFEGFVGGCLDIHEQKQAAEKARLADETLRLMKIQDEERRRIARELHDSAGQTLTVLGLSLAQLVQDAESVAPQLAESGKQIEEIVQQLHREIRTTSYLLHPPLLDEAGLSSALRWYVEGAEERSGMSIDLSISDKLGRLPADMELAVFRIVQECLTNIHRHAESKTGSIRIARQNGAIRIEVHDQGKGMPPERLAEIQTRGSGVGIRGIRERLRQFHGEMKIESDASGTRFFATIPLPKQDGSKQMEGFEIAV